jgi:hypothetical protein
VLVFLRQKNQEFSIHTDQNGYSEHNPSDPEKSPSGPYQSTGFQDQATGFQGILPAPSVA